MCFKRGTFAFQKPCFYPPKGHLLHSKTWPFAAQNATFYNPIATPLFSTTYHPLIFYVSTFFSFFTQKVCKDSSFKALQCCSCCSSFLAYICCYVDVRCQISVFIEDGVDSWQLTVLFSCKKRWKRWFQGESKIGIFNNTL